MRGIADPLVTDTLGSTVSGLLNWPFYRAVSIIKQTPDERKSLENKIFKSYPIS